MLTGDLRLTITLFIQAVVELTKSGQYQILLLVPKHPATPLPSRKQALSCFLILRNYMA